LVLHQLQVLVELEQVVLLHQLQQVPPQEDLHLLLQREHQQLQELG
jgi:hypothetical protein